MEEGIVIITWLKNHKLLYHAAVLDYFTRKFYHSNSKLLNNVFQLELSIWVSRNFADIAIDYHK